MAKTLREQHLSFYVVLGDWQAEKSDSDEAFLSGEVVWRAIQTALAGRHKNAPGYQPLGREYGEGAWTLIEGGSPDLTTSADGKFMAWPVEFKSSREFSVDTARALRDLCLTVLAEVAKDSGTSARLDRVETFSEYRVTDTVVLNLDAPQSAESTTAHYVDLAYQALKPAAPDLFQARKVGVVVQVPVPVREELIARHGTAAREMLAWLDGQVSL